MEKFDWTQFTQKIAIKASIKTLYSAWAVPREIEKWFLSDTIFKRDDVVLAKDTNVEAGDSYLWKWHLYDGGQEGKITSANGKNHIQFTFIRSIVDIKLEKVGDHVVVHLSQSEIPTDDLSKQDIRLGCHTGWLFFLVGLKAYYENGIDLRNKDARFAGSVN